MDLVSGLFHVKREAPPTSPSHLWRHLDDRHFEIQEQMSPFLDDLPLEEVDNVEDIDNVDDTGDDEQFADEEEYLLDSKPELGEIETEM